MGKYTHVIDKLSPLPIEDKSSQAKVDAIKAELRANQTWTPEALASEYAIAREVKEDLNDQLSLINKRVTALEQMMEDSLKNDEPGWGLYGATPTMIKLKDGSSVSIQYEPVGKVEEPEFFRQWIISNGYENQLTLPWQRREELVKNALLAGEEPPDGIKAYSRPKVVFRKG